jgi:ABC-2 type transport system ATP-binding protein
MEPILKVQSLGKVYGAIRAVDNLSFTVNKGEVYGILGPNGSGKTTTLSMLSGVVNPMAGSWSWFGMPMNYNARTRMGVLLEKPNFYGYLSAVNNLKIVADIRSVDHDKIPEVLERVGLSKRMHSKFKTYSLGMKQRLAIGSALLGNPEVLILDEPTNGLDPRGIAEVRELIVKLAQEGITIIIASHMLDEVQKVCSNVLVLQKGVKLYDGKVSQLLNDSTKIVIDAQDKAKLKEIIQTHPKVNDIRSEQNMFMLDVNDDCTTEELNAYAFEYGVSLSHLAYDSVSLEDKLLQLLKPE